MPDQDAMHPLLGGDPARPQTWRELCARCNDLGQEQGGWWRRIVSDPEAVPRVDESGITVRLRGNPFVVVQLRGRTPLCRIAPEHLFMAHPGARTVLGEVKTAGEPKRIQSLEDLACHYDHVRRRVCQHVDRRQNVLDRLFLRHPCILAVDAALPHGQADLVALSPEGTAVFFLLRRYSDGDLRLRGRGGIIWRMGELNRWLADEAAVATWGRELLERSAALQTRHSRRYGFSKTVTVHPRARLLIVDFDHAQRQSGLPSLLDEFDTNIDAGLDRMATQSDILCIGDPGNIFHRTLFSGI